MPQANFAYDFTFRITGDREVVAALDTMIMKGKEVVEGTRSSSKAMGAFGDELEKTISRFVTSQKGAAKLSMDFLRTSSQVVSNLKAQNQAIIELAKRRGYLLESEQEQLTQNNQKILQHTDFIQQNSKALNVNSQEFEINNRFIASNTSHMRSVDDALNKFSISAVQAKNQQQEFNDKLKHFRSVASVAVSEMKILANDVEGGRVSTDVGRASWQMYTEQLERVVAQLREYISTQSLSAEETAKATALLANITESAENAQRGFAGTGNTMRGMNKVASGSNQILLSFGDILQDSSQFSFGFAQGARAIGNNIAFAAEQFVILQANMVASTGKAVGFRAVMSGIGASLLGPIGVVVGISALVTIVTVASQAMEKARKKTEDLGKESSALTDIFADQEKQLKSVINTLNELSKVTVSDLEDSYKRIGSEITSISGAISDLEQKEKSRVALGFEQRRILSSISQLQGNQRDELLSRLEVVMSEREQLEKVKVTNKEDLAILRQKRKELAQQLKELNTQSRLAELTYESRYEQQKLVITEYINEIEAQNQLEATESRRIHLMDSINSKIKENANQARKEREEALAFEADLLQRVLNPPKMEQDASELVEDRIMDTVKRNIAAQQQLEIFRKKSNMRTVADYEAAQKAEINLLEYYLNAKEITEGEYLLRKAQIEDETTKATTAIREQAMQAERDAYEQLSAGIFAVLSSAFKDSKAVAIAETIISTYFAAQKQFEQTSAIPGVGPLAAPAAAASAIAQGLARVIAIKNTEIGSSSVSAGAGNGASQKSFGFQMNQIDGQQRFRLPGFEGQKIDRGGRFSDAESSLGYMPENNGRYARPKVDVKVMANRKQLYAMVKHGEEEYRQVKI